MKNVSSDRHVKTKLVDFIEVRISCCFGALEVLLRKLSKDFLTVAYPKYLSCSYLRRKNLYFASHDRFENVLQLLG